LRARYRQRKEQALERARAISRAAQYSDADMTELRGLFHKLAGSSGTFGDAELGRLAAVAEEGLAAWSAAERPARLEALLAEIGSAEAEGASATS
jgi:HPt (histidine-containing phosphotransfer) domain-containing protein